LTFTTILEIALGVLALWVATLATFWLVRPKGVR
jgi:hypothetical protein